MPVAVAVMTPVLPMILWTGQKVAAKIRRPKHEKKEVEVSKVALSNDRSVNSQCNLIGDHAFLPGLACRT